MRQAGVMDAASLWCHYLLPLSQGNDMSLRVLCARTAERVRERLRRTLMVTSLVSGEGRSANH